MQKAYINRYDHFVIFNNKDQFGCLRVEEWIGINHSHHQHNYSLCFSDFPNIMY